MSTTSKMKNSDNQKEMYSVDALDKFLERIEKYTLAISGMLFQDAYNFDIERVKRCYIMEVLEDGRTIPFCAYNLTSDSGESLYRK